MNYTPSVLPTEIRKDLDHQPAIVYNEILSASAPQTHPQTNDLSLAVVLQDLLSHRQKRFPTPLNTVDSPWNFEDWSDPVQVVYSWTPPAGHSRAIDLGKQSFSLHFFGRIKLEKVRVEEFLSIPYCNVFCSIFSRSTFREPAPWSFPLSSSRSRDCRHNDLVLQLASFKSISWRLASSSRSSSCLFSRSLEWR